jgi:antitoxin (DNA-binding transcriptional repressor) of toxin-antitoxin stability system
MEIVGIRQLKNHLSEFVRRARTGERIGISHHGELVAELRAPEPGIDQDIPQGLRDLVLQGVTGRIVRNDPTMYEVFEPALKSMTSKELLDWDREDR